MTSTQVTRAVQRTPTVLIAVIAATSTTAATVGAAGTTYAPNAPAAAAAEAVLPTRNADPARRADHGPIRTPAWT